MVVVMNTGTSSLLLEQCSLKSLEKSELSDPAFVERSPDNRYIRYNKILGRGAFKTVYKGFDEIDGIEVAWSVVDTDDLLLSPENLERIYSEIHLLKTLRHENVIKFYIFWEDNERKTINMITELFSSGSLRQYRKNHMNVDMKAIKNWSKQILLGLNYLHSQSPPIIHRDLKCDNIFVNGSHGEVKIGDLGFAKIMLQSTAHSVVGTPEFMAPELYDEEYNELVDIYSFGLCILELITCEYPYKECKNQAQIYKKVTSGIKPASLGKINDQQAKQFIEKCIVAVSQRLSASELLKDPFLSSESSISPPKLDPVNMIIETNCDKLSSSTNAESSIETIHAWSTEFQRFNERNEYLLRGEKNDERTVSLSLRITDLCGQVRNIHFMFYLDTDTTSSLAGEMVEQLDLWNEDIAFIAELIDDLIFSLVPTWKPSVGHNSYASFTNHVKFANNPTTIMCSTNSACSMVPYSALVEEQVLSMVTERVNQGAKIADSMSSKVACVASNVSDTTEHSIDNCNNALQLYNSNQLRVGDVESVTMSDNSETSELSVINSRYLVSNNVGSASKGQEEHIHELEQELYSIDMRYYQCCHELLRMKVEAVEHAKRKWLTKKT